MVARGVFAAAALVAWWMHGLVSSRARYVATVKPLASDPTLQSVLTTADRSGQLGAELKIDHGAAVAQGPPRPASGQRTVHKILDQQVCTVVSQVVSGPDFITLGASVNRTAHPDVAALLTGSGPKGHTRFLCGNQVMLNTAAIVGAVKTQLAAKGLPFAAQVSVPGQTVVVARVSHVSRVRVWIGRLDRSAPWLPWASGACFLLAVVGAAAGP